MFCITQSVTMALLMMLQQKQLCISPSVTIAPFMMSKIYRPSSSLRLLQRAFMMSDCSLVLESLCFILAVCQLVYFTAPFMSPTAIFPTDINHSPVLCVKASHFWTLKQRSREFHTGLWSRSLKAVTVTSCMLSLWSFH